MSVFTTVSFEALADWLRDYAVGDLRELKGIAAGITNTNYFVTTSQSRYVLTLFEQHTLDELHYFFDLMTHLAQQGVACPNPVLGRSAQALGMLQGKPAAMVTCLPGRDVEVPSVNQCHAVGQALAKLHLAGQNFPQKVVNPRGLAWRQACAKKLYGLLEAKDLSLLDAALESDLALAQIDLPSGVIHADLFRDNVLFEQDQLGGIIDFYYACHDAWLYDIAIAVNDWCSDTEGRLQIHLKSALLSGYHAIRPLTQTEQDAWPRMLQVAALRFWLSRLLDQHFPQSGEITHTKDPQQFRAILQHRLTDASTRDHQSDICWRQILEKAQVC